MDHLQPHTCGETGRLGFRKWQRAGALSLPVLVLLTGSFELFPPPGWVDPMIYAGYFLDARLQIESFGAYYFSNRVPFIAIGSLAYALFEPTTAHLALLLLWQTVAVLSLFSILRTLTRWPVAVVGSWWLGVNPLWIATLSSGYVDAPAIAMSLAALALLRSGVNRGAFMAWIQLVASGILFGLVAAFHPLPAVFAGAAALTFLLAHAAPQYLWPQSTALVTGFLTSILAQGIYSSWLGGPFWFLLGDLTPVKNALTGESRRFIRPMGEWLDGALRLGLPVLIGLLGASLLVRGRHLLTEAQKSLGLMGTVTIWLTLLLMMAWDIYANGLMLQSKFYASYLLLGQSLLAAFVIAYLNDTPLPRDGSYFAAAAAVFFLTLGLIVGHEPISVLLNEMESAAKWWSFAACAALLLALAHFEYGKGATILLFAITIFVGIANVDTRAAWKESGTVPFRQIYELALSVRQSAEYSNLRGRRVKVWLDRSTFTTGDRRSDQRGKYEIYLWDGNLTLNAFDSVAALWLWDKGTLNFQMPQLSEADLDWLKTPGVPTSIIMVCMQQTDCNHGHLAMDRAEIPTETRTRAIIWKPGLPPVTVLVVDYLYSEPAAQPAS